MEIRACPPGETVCDFCSEPNPARTFTVPDFLLDGDSPRLGLPFLKSTGNWLACSTCGGYIDAGEWERLALRAVERLAAKHPELPRRIIFARVTQGHDLFRAHYEKKS